MLDARPLRVAPFLIALAIAPGFHAAPARGEQEIIKMIRPGAREILIGGATFAFEVADVDPAVDRIDVFVNGRLVGAAGPGEWTFRWVVPEEVQVTDVDAVAFSGDVVRDRVHVEPRGPVLNAVEKVRLVQLYPAVTKINGRYVEDLRSEDFRILENGIQVDIRYFSVDPATLSLVLLLDGSESMLEYLPQVQVAALRFLDLLGADDRLAVYSFNQRATRAVGFGAGRDQAMAAILDLDASGSTALYDAIAQVIDDLRAVKGRKALFVFSDGKDRQSFVSKERTLDLARANDVLIYAVATGEDDASIAAREDLRKLADESGGQFFLVRNPVKIGEALEATLRDLRAQYVLSYSPPPGPSGIREIKVEVVDHPYYNVRHRTTYHYASRDDD